MSRPISEFHGFIGQGSEVARLRSQLAGGKVRGQPLKLALLAGPSGVGKTTLAKAAALHLETGMICVSAHDGPEALAEALAGAPAESILFVDEAHNLSAKAQELLYQVIDEGSLPAWAGREAAHASEAAEGSNPAAAQPRCIHPLSIILATDQPGVLRDALLKRVDLRVHLRLYTRSEMRAIIARMEPQLQIALTPQARTRLAAVTGGLPRSARYLLGQMRRHYSQYDGVIDVPRVERFLQSSGIDRLGLGGAERSYLKHLERMGRASLETLAMQLGFDASYVRTHIEGPLVRLGLLNIGTGGRRLSGRGQAWTGRRRVRKDRDQKTTGSMSSSSTGIEAPALREMG